jgi:hypothetical protein
VDKENFQDESKDKDDKNPFGWFTLENDNVTVVKANGYMPEDLELKSFM